MQGGDGKQSLHRFSFDLATGNVKEETLDDRGMEFPRVADARVGLKNRYGFTLGFGGAGGAGAVSFAGHYKFDLQTGKSELHPYGEGMSPGEPVFVPAAGAGPVTVFDPGFDLHWKVV